MNENYKMVKLISYSSPSSKLIEENIKDAQELIAFCARVSNPSNQFNTETSEKLINYLIKHKHWSPMEMANVCLEINCPRDIARQILRHRSFSFQEFSQRYADPVKDLSFRYRDARLQDAKNRQNSIDINDAVLENLWNMMQEKVVYAAKDAYEWAIKKGIAKEIARAVLPEGLTMSRMYMNGTIRSWIHYIEIRSDPATQKEHREIAIQCANEIAKILPSIVNFVYKEPVKQQQLSEWIGL